MKLKIFYLVLIVFLPLKVLALENCNWNNNQGIPCTVITKTPNSSEYNTQGINKKVFTKQQINESGATSAIDLIKKVSRIIKLVRITFHNLTNKTYIIFIIKILYTQYN